MPPTSTRPLVDQPLPTIPTSFPPLTAMMGRVATMLTQSTSGGRINVRPIDDRAVCCDYKVSHLAVEKGGFGEVHYARINGK